MKLDGKNLCFSYEQESIFRDLNFQIKAGRLTSIIGPNGVGKSTLIKCMSSIYNLNSGEIYLDEDLLKNKSSRELAKILGYVPQKENTNFSITVYEMILLGRRPYIKWKVGDKDKKIVDKLLEKMKIEHLAERYIKTLSGGERQKTAIARALAQEPDILLLDEPTASLDLNHQVEVMKILQQLAHKEKTAVVTVLHDLNLASRFSDRVFLMGDKGFYKVGPPEKVFTEENIKNIYNIEVEILKTSQGNVIVPRDTETSC
ncbi:MAG: ABC transporter ATP-binding protein [Halothermotrichaceae bacterium]